MLQILGVFVFNKPVKLCEVLFVLSPCSFQLINTYLVNLAGHIFLGEVGLAVHLGELVYPLDTFGFVKGLVVEIVVFDVGEHEDFVQDFQNLAVDFPLPFIQKSSFKHATNELFLQQYQCV